MGLTEIIWNGFGIFLETFGWIGAIIILAAFTFELCSGVADSMGDKGSKK